MYTASWVRETIASMKEKGLAKYMIDNIHPNSLGALQSAKTIWSVMANVPLKAR